MTITLTPDLERTIKDHIAGGQFTTPEEVIRIGLQLLNQKGCGLCGSRNHAAMFGSFCAGVS